MPNLISNSLHVTHNRQIVDLRMLVCFPMLEQTISLCLLQDNVTDHCVSKWIFYAGNLIVNVSELMQRYEQAWQNLPADLVSSH